MFRRNAIRYLLMFTASCGLARGQVIYYPFDYSKVKYLPNLIAGTIEHCDGTVEKYRGGDYQDQLNYCKAMPPVHCPHGDEYALCQIPSVSSGEICDTWGDVFGNTDVAYWEHYMFNASCNVCPDGTILAASKCDTLTNLPPYWNYCAGCQSPSDTPVKIGNGIVQCAPKCDHSEIRVTNGTNSYCSGNCTLSPSLKDWIKKNEGFCPGPTRCSGALGYGHDCSANKDCGTISTPMTTDTASTLFDKDLPGYIHFISNNLPNVGDLNRNQFAALVDYAFNTGAGSPKYLNQYFRDDMTKKNFSSMCTKMKTAFTLPDTHTYNKKTKKWVLRPHGPEQGKINRRNNEADKCNTPTDTRSGC